MCVIPQATARQIHFQFRQRKAVHHKLGYNKLASHYTEII